MWNLQVLLAVRPLRLGPKTKVAITQKASAEEAEGLVLPCAGKGDGARRTFPHAI